MIILNIENVKKVYSNGKQALKGLSLHVNKGEFIGLLGPNGAGKSTLINILSDVVTRTSGTITLNNFDIDKNKIEFKHGLGVVPQDINFDPFFTPIEAIMLQQGIYGFKPNKAKALDLLDKLGLKNQANSYTRSLSGGMKRRLLIAKAMVHDPDILILDEPTAGVDIELRQNLWALLQELNQAGKTIILTTHYLEEAQQLCDKIAIINHGELIAYEDKQNLINKVGNRLVQITLDKNLKENIGFDYTTDPQNVINITYKEEKEVGDILKKLIDLNYTIESIKTKESSLEEVFLKLTSSKSI